MELHLVDGTYELFRAYYGAPPSRAPDGKEVGALRGIARTLLALVANEGASHVGVAFDHVVESFRNELFSGYKTGDGIEPALRAQFEPAEELTRALGFVVWPMVEFEADDALASAAARFGGDARVDRVIICSPDKDLTQLVGTGVVCLDRRRGNWLDERAVVEKFGVAPASMPDWLALVGDAADGIPGIPRWGARSTATILAQYSRIEAIPPDPDSWSVKVRGAAGLSRSLEEHRSDALLYRRLATLRQDVPLAESLDDLAWRGADRGALETICRTSGDEKLLDRVPHWR